MYFCRRPHAESDIKHPKAKVLIDKWHHVWLLAMERQRRLQDKYNYLTEVQLYLKFYFSCILDFELEYLSFRICFYKTEHKKEQQQR